jgi:hypothetical protein
VGGWPLTQYPFQVNSELLVQTVEGDCRERGSKRLSKGEEDKTETEGSTLEYMKKRQSI